MRTPLVLLVSLTILACGEAPETGDSPPPEGDPPTAAADFQDTDVARIHERMMEAMAPRGGWERARYLEFDWRVAREEEDDVRRSHRWDRFTGRYHVEAPVDGGFMTALFPVDDPEEGRVWVDSEVQEGPRADSLLDRAHRMFINDSYWLLMPYKWTDPGVRTSFLGPHVDDDGREWEVVELTFDDVGRTPQNIYHAYVNPESGLMERWTYRSSAEAEDSLTTDWTGWRDFGPVRLSLERPTHPEGERRIYFESVEVREEVPAGAFDPPSSSR